MKDSLPTRIERRSRDIGIALAVFLVAAAYAAFFHDKGITMAEEGQIVTEGVEILNGRVLYRDIDGFVAPAVWYLAALVLRVAGPDLNATRWVMVALFAATALVLYAIGRRVGSTRSGVAAVGLLFVQKALAFPLGVFLFYTEFALFFALCAVYALVRSSGAPGWRWGLATGSALALCLLFKQNIGAFSIAASVGYLLCFERKASLLVPAIGLPAACAIGVTAAFAAAGGFDALVYALVTIPFVGFAQTASIPYLGVFASSDAISQLLSFTPALFFEEFVLGVFGDAGQWIRPAVVAISMGVYLVPAGVALASIVNALRAPDRVPLLLWIGALATLGGAFPRSDFPHVAQALVGFIPIGLYEFARLRARSARSLARVAVSLFALTAGVLVACMPYDRHFEHPRARLWLSSASYESLTRGLAWIEESVPAGARLAVFPTNAMFYFLADRRVPLRYTIVLSHNLHGDDGRVAAQQLDAHGVDWVLFSVIQMPDFGRFEQFAPALADALQTRFEVVRSIGDETRGLRLLHRKHAASAADAVDGAGPSTR